MDAENRLSADSKDYVMALQWLILWNCVQTFATFRISGIGRAIGVLANSATYLWDEWRANCYMGQVRGREGIWGSAQRSRWKFWARSEGPKDERQSKPALAFSIWAVCQRSMTPNQKAHADTR
jgi:hypothetical protein